MVLLNVLRSTLSEGDSVSNVHDSVITGEISWYRLSSHTHTYIYKQYQNRIGG